MNTESTNTIDITELKKIRNKKKISLEALADTLKVRKDFIKYIESGDFDKLGAPTFIKGHVTNYCKALDLSAEAVIQQIPDSFLQIQTIQPSDAMGASPLARVRRKSNYLGKYAVGTALLSMLALSFYFVWDKWSLPADTAPQSMSLMVESSETDQKNKPGGKNITYSSMIPQVKLDNQPTESQVGQSTELENEPASVDQAEAIKGDGSEQGQDEGQDGIQIQAEERTDVEADTLQTMAAYSIQLQLVEEAWVSIQTNEGEKLVHDLVGPGTYTYQSEKPVSFRIGNAKSSSVAINGTEINLQDYMKRDIADFSWPIDPS